MTNIGGVKQQVEAARSHAENADDMAKIDSEVLQHLSLADIQKRIGDIVTDLAWIHASGDASRTHIGKAAIVNTAIKNAANNGMQEIYNAFGNEDESSDEDAAGMRQSMQQIGEDADHQADDLHSMRRNVTNAVAALMNVQEELGNYGLLLESAVTHAEKARQHAADTIDHANNYMIRH